MDGCSQSGIEQIPGLPQLFIKRNSAGRIVLALCKIVDDILIIWSNDAIDEFYKQLSDRVHRRSDDQRSASHLQRLPLKMTGWSLIIRHYRCHSCLFSNRLRISRNDNGNVTYDMEEYFSSIRSLEVPRFRRESRFALLWRWTEAVSFVNGITQLVEWQSIASGVLRRKLPSAVVRELYCFGTCYG